MNLPLSTVNCTGIAEDVGEGTSNQQPATSNCPDGRLAYGLKEAAWALSIGVTLLKEEVRCGRIRSVKIGKRRIIPRAELERYLAAE